MAAPTRLNPSLHFVVDLQHYDFAPSSQYSQIYQEIANAVDDMQQSYSNIFNKLSILSTTYQVDQHVLYVN
jgi:cation transport regulator ChaC